ncbi:MAG: glycerophosphodiester phosphodiesterase family protein [Stackebrandtia sp.]
MFASRKSRRRLAAVALLAGVAATSAGVGSAAHADEEAENLPPCPEVFGHGGYPTGPDGWERDQVRQPNNPTALQDQKDMGASGVEVDLQLTRDGTKAVMWHNGSTYWLTGSHANVNTLWWDTGADKLNGRTIEVGPYRDEVVHTLRQFLDSAHEKTMVPLIEIKPSAEQSLLHSDPAIRDRAWSEVLDPIAERVDRQEIMMYTHSDNLRPEMVERVTAAGLEAIISPQANGPVWPDTVAWEEPPPSWEGNEASWQATLDEEPSRMATTWTREMHDWLEGRCA